jgi:predicted transcriptional regulator
MDEYGGSMVSEVTSLRLDDETAKLLNFLSDRMNIPKSVIIRLALKEFLEKSLNDKNLSNEIRIYILHQNAKNQIRKIKLLKWIRHQLIECERQLTMIQNARKGEYKNAVENSIRIFSQMSVEELDKVEKYERNLAKTLMRMLKVMKAERRETDNLP